MLKQQKWPGIRAVLITLSLMQAGTVSAQVLTPDLPYRQYLDLAATQIQQGHYALAAQAAGHYLAGPEPKLYARRTEDIEEAKYYLALAGLKGGLPGSTEGVNEAINSINITAYRERLAFAAAQAHFRQEHFAKAIPYYEQAGISNLNNSEITDAKFELAYSYFSIKEFTKADPLLQAIKEMKEGKYYLPGNYYYGLLAYNQNRYKDALRSFDRIKDTKEYSPVVPYYIAEVYYFMGNKDKAYKQADSILKRKEKSFYDKELHLLAGQCLYEQQRYKDAKPYFEYYYDHSDKIRKEDLYEIAYVYYKTDDWKNAIEKFRMLSDTRDSLGQTSMYQLGDCYLKTGDKSSARNAFGICADMNFNKSLQESAMVLYAMTSYETGYNDDALRMLNTLMNDFPATRYADVANTLISDLLVKTNNFAEALEHLEAVTQKDDHYRKVYQKAAFGYAVQEYRDGNIDTAAVYFNQSLAHPAYPEMEAAAWFWKGEIAYRRHQYADVIANSQQFVASKANKVQVEKLSPQSTMQLWKGKIIPKLKTISAGPSSSRTMRILAPSPPSGRPMLCLCSATMTVPWYCMAK